MTSSSRLEFHVIQCMLRPSPNIVIVDQPKMKKASRKFFRHSLLIAGIHAGSFQCAKVNTMWVDAIAKFHFQGHFEGQKNDL